MHVKCSKFFDDETENATTSEQIALPIDYDDDDDDDYVKTYDRSSGVERGVEGEDRPERQS